MKKQASVYLYLLDRFPGDPKLGEFLDVIYKLLAFYNLISYYSRQRGYKAETIGDLLLEYDLDSICNITSNPVYNSLIPRGLKQTVSSLCSGKPTASGVGYGISILERGLRNINSLRNRADNDEVIRHFYHDVFAQADAKISEILSYFMDKLNISPDEQSRILMNISRLLKSPIGLRMLFLESPSLMSQIIPKVTNIEKVVSDSSIMKQLDPRKIMKTNLEYFEQLPDWQDQTSSNPDVYMQIIDERFEEQKATVLARVCDAMLEVTDAILKMKSELRDFDPVHATSMELSAKVRSALSDYIPKVAAFIHLETLVSAFVPGVEPIPVDYWDRPSRLVYYMDKLYRNNVCRSSGVAKDAAVAAEKSLHNLLHYLVEHNKTDIVNEFLYGSSWMYQVDLKLHPQVYKSTVQELQENTRNNGSNNNLNNPK